MIRHVCSLLFPRRRLVGAKFGLTFSLARPTAYRRAGGARSIIMGRAAYKASPLGGGPVHALLFLGLTLSLVGPGRPHSTHKKENLGQEDRPSGHLWPPLCCDTFPPSSFERALTSRYLFSCQYFRVPLCQIGACSEVMMEAEAEAATYRCFQQL